VNLFTDEELAWTPRGVVNPLFSSCDGKSADAIEGLLSVCFPDARTIFDATYGNGMFYAGSSRRVWGADLNPSRARDLVASYEALPLLDASVDVIVFDPPFQPHTTNGLGLIGARFTKVHDEGGGCGMGAVRQLKASVQCGAMEAKRCARLGFIVKVQDYIHSRRPVWMSMWLWEALGEPYDFLTLRVPSKLRATTWQNQLSVWRNHSTFWVWRNDSAANYHRERVGKPVSVGAVDPHARSTGTPTPREKGSSSWEQWKQLA
jgi:hypothetical protein